MFISFNEWLEQRLLKEYAFKCNKCGNRSDNLNRNGMCATCVKNRVKPSSSKVLRGAGGQSDPRYAKPQITRDELGQRSSG